MTKIKRSILRAYMTAVVVANTPRELPHPVDRSRQTGKRTLCLLSFASIRHFRDYWDFSRHSLFLSLSLFRGMRAAIIFLFLKLRSLCASEKTSYTLLIAEILIGR